MSEVQRTNSQPFLSREHRPIFSKADPFICPPTPGGIEVSEGAYVLPIHRAATYTGKKLRLGEDRPRPLPT